jgi:hypothetical protein
MGHIHGARTRPIRRRHPSLLKAPLCCEVVVEIRGDHIIIIVAQAVGQFSELAAVFENAKCAGLDRFDNSGEQRRRGDGRLSTQASLTAPFNFVECTDRLRAIQRELHVSRA